MKTNTTIIVKTFAPIAIGAIAGIGAAVIAKKRASKAKEIIDEYKEEIDVIDEAVKIVSEEETREKYTEEDELKDRVVVTTKAIKDIVKAYAPVIGLGVLAVGCVVIGCKNCVDVSKTASKVSNYVNSHDALVNILNSQKDDCVVDSAAIHMAYSTNPVYSERIGKIMSLIWEVNDVSATDLINPNSPEWSKFTNITSASGNLLDHVYNSKTNERVKK